MDPILARQWRSLTYRDPKAALRRSQRRLHGVAARGDPFGNLRSARDRTFRESHQAALFCHGFAEVVLQREVQFALSEDSDYDCVFSWREGNDPTFVPVQLKEVVPDTLNPSSNLDEVLRKLTRYASSGGLVVAIHLNRTGIHHLPSLELPELNIRELWIFGATGRSPSEWALFGNLMEKPKLYLFEHP
jgi:hypothetical protein